MKYDFVIVGAGIVGLATAYKLSEKFPERKILVLEKESRAAVHQSGNNSGVIHSGIYYKPGSYKARSCTNGRKQLIEFCRKQEIDYKICGKVIIAAEDEEIPRLQTLYERGIQNGIEGIEFIDKARLKEIEPYAQGKKALWIPETGIVDFSQVCERLKALLEKNGGVIKFSSKVIKIIPRRDELLVKTDSNEFPANYLINCAGLQSDRVARAAGIISQVRIVPFRGEYYRLTEAAAGMVRGLIYPAPDPAFPFLGVHFTRMISGKIECGPNAVLALKREGYEKISFNLKDTWDTLSYPGFWKLAMKYFKMGFAEMRRSHSKRAFVKGLQKLIPSIESEHIVPASAGVRANAMNGAGKVLDDFYILKQPRQVHILNAPSPAATAALSLGDEIVRIAEDFFDI